jgi:serine/threonine protein kinase
MGEVYRARDTRLARDVAIKVLPADFAADTERLKRFEREAKATAALNHPNILAIFDVGTHETAPFIVTELLEGGTLQDRLKAGGLTVSKAVEVAVQIAQGLAAAHEKGIVHRDLKPANVFVTKDGHVKILDFGIAKLVERSPHPGQPPEGTTLVETTQPGVVMGTFSYMSPEQARGQPVDHRSDIFSFGTVLFELLAGARPFVGETATDAVAAILTQEPPALPATVPPALDHLVRRCLEKRPEDRFDSTRSLALTLEAFSTPAHAQTAQEPQAPPVPKRVNKKALAAAAAVALLALGVAWLLRQRTAVPKPTGFQLLSTFPGSHRSPNFSPDGTMITFIDDFEGVPQVWVKNLAQGDPIRITSGTVGAGHPQWSPRGDRIVFLRGDWKTPGGIWSVPPLGGEPRRIIETGWSPSFSGDGQRIAFERQDGIFTAAADGSDERRVEGAPANLFDSLDLSPAFSPDGKWIAYFLPEEGPHGDFWVVSAGGGKPRRLTSDLSLGGTPAWTPDSRSVIFSSTRTGGRTLWRIPGDGGDPQPVTTGAGEDREPAVSRDGRSLIYTNERVSYALMLLNTATGEQRQVLEQRNTISMPAFSPEGDRMAFMIDEASSSQLFTIGTDGRGLHQVTTKPGELHVQPQWSHDGAYLFYYQLYPVRSFRKVPVAGGSSTELLPDWSWATRYAGQVDPQDSRIAYTLREGNQGRASVVRDLKSGSETRLSLVIWEPRWSADGKYLLGTSVGGTDVVLCPVAGGTCQQLANGFLPLWSGDGTRILFHRPGSASDVTEVWAMKRDGSDQRRVAELRSRFGLSFLGLSRNDQLAWVQVRRGRQELWLAELPR